MVKSMKSIEFLHFGTTSQVQPVILHQPCSPQCGLPQGLRPAARMHMLSPAGDFCHGPQEAATVLQQGIVGAHRHGLAA